VVEELIELLEHLNAWLVRIFQLFTLVLRDLFVFVIDVL
jgi:hypothetical protein